MSGKLSRVEWWVKVGFAELYYYYYYPREYYPGWTRMERGGRPWYLREMYVNHGQGMNMGSPTKPAPPLRPLPFTFLLFSRFSPALAPSLSLSSHRLSLVFLSLSAIAFSIALVSFSEPHTYYCLLFLLFLVVGASWFCLCKRDH